MTAQMDLPAVERVEITVLMDNYSDILLPSTPTMKRHPLADDQGGALEQPLAGHGLSLLIETCISDEKHVTLLDFGFPTPGVEYNWRVLGVDRASVEAAFLSHGHADHFAALGAFLEARDDPLPVVAHPGVFRKRALIFPDGRRVDVERLSTPRALEAKGAELTLTAELHQLAPGLFSSGEVARVTPFEEGRFPSAHIEVDGEWRQDRFRDDQAVVARLKDKGLVVITGCAHAGIVNTAKHARMITGEERMHAIIGGFHLTGASPEVIESTIQEMQAMSPALIVPMHCTGFEAKCAFAREMSERFALSSVGTRIMLPGSESRREVVV
jgi:7,8-dihydropterin-6-yl-methyl-4-(beta-D-ribofuranosyl)aminobenzene 5'-phosphate synthase